MKIRQLVIVATALLPVNCETPLRSAHADSWVKIPEKYSGYWCVNHELGTVWNNNFRRCDDLENRGKGWMDIFTYGFLDGPYFECRVLSVKYLPVDDIVRVQADCRHPDGTSRKNRNRCFYWGIRDEELISKRCD